MKAKHLKNQSKASFERYLSERIGDQTLEFRKHPEINHETGKYTVLWLYYNDSGHIGTWVKRTCWIFEDNLPDADHETGQGDESPSITFDKWKNEVISEFRKLGYTTSEIFYFIKKANEKTSRDVFSTVAFERGDEPIKAVKRVLCWAGNFNGEDLLGYRAGI